MPRRPAIPSFLDAMKKKMTCREQFLVDLDAVVPRFRLVTLIAPHCPKIGPKGGRPPMPLETMLRVYSLQNWSALIDPMAEETLYHSKAMRRFAGIALGDDRIPEETTILNFRHPREQHLLTEAIFADVNAPLHDKVITLRSGTPVEATIIAAPCSTKAKVRDPEMSFTKKGWDELLYGEEPSVWADKGYASAQRQAPFKAPGKVLGVKRRPLKGGNLHHVDAQINRIIAMVMAKVEHPFRVIKRQFGLTKTRAQLFILFAFGNPFLVRRRLLA